MKKDTRVFGFKLFDDFMLSIIFLIISVIVLLSTIFVIHPRYISKLSNKLYDSAVLNVFEQQYECTKVDNTEQIKTDKSIITKGPTYTFDLVGTNKFFSSDSFETTEGIASDVGEKATVYVCVAVVNKEQKWYEDATKQYEQYVYRDTNFDTKEEFIEQCTNSLKNDLKDAAIDQSSNNIELIMLYMSSIVVIFLVGVIVIDARSAIEERAIWIANKKQQKSNE